MLLHCSMRYKLFVLLVALLAILIWVTGCVVQFLVRTAAIMHVRHRATSRGQATHTTSLDSVQSSSRAGFTPQSLRTTQTCSAIRVLISIGAACYRWTHQPANQPTVRRTAAGSVTALVILLILACGAPVPTSGPIASGGAVGTGGWPVPPGTPITRGYGCHPFYTGVRGPCGNLWWHDGIDWAAAPGTPLFAVRDISIQFAGADTGSMDCS